MKVHYRFPALITVVLLSGCSSMTGRSNPPVADAARRAALFEHTQALFSQGQYDAAYNENQKILQEGRGDPDVALFNMGMISAHRANPQKNYARALSSFRKLIEEYPHSQMVEPAKSWIQVLEEYRRVAEEKRVLIEEKRMLLEEKRMLLRERESLVREKQKLKYTTEKSRQVDMEIEKRRREMLLRK